MRVNIVYWLRLNMIWFIDVYEHVCMVELSLKSHLALVNYSSLLCE